MPENDPGAAGPAPECQICPICAGLAAPREARPDAVEHLVKAGAELLLAAKALLDGATEPTATRRPPGGDAPARPAPAGRPATVSSASTSASRRDPTRRGRAARRRHGHRRDQDRRRRGHRGRPGAGLDQGPDPAPTTRRLPRRPCWRSPTSCWPATPGGGDRARRGRHGRVAGRPGPLGPPQHLPAHGAAPPAARADRPADDGGQRRQRRRLGRGPLRRPGPAPTTWC